MKGNNNQSLKLQIEHETSPLNNKSEIRLLQETAPLTKLSMLQETAPLRQVATNINIIKVLLRDNTYGTYIYIYTYIHTHRHTCK